MKKTALVLTIAIGMTAGLALADDAGGPPPGAPPPPGMGPRHHADFPEITIPELKQAIDAKTVTLLDANGTGSWQSGHIPGAIDFGANKDKLASLLPADKNALIVAYCGGPQCHAFAAAARAAKQLGYTNIKHLTAGISGWKRANEPTEKGG